MLQNKNMPQLVTRSKASAHARSGSDRSRRTVTPDQLIDQVSNGTPGGGNMPAYGKQISPANDRAHRLPHVAPAQGPAAGWLDHVLAVALGITS